MDNHDPELRKMGEAFEEVSRQLAAANERAGRLEAQMAELREAWRKWQTPTTTDLANHAEAEFERILGGA